MPDAPNQADIDALMKALGADPGVPASKGAPRPAPGKMEYEPLAPAAPSTRPEQGLELLNDVNVKVRLELGSARMVVQEILKLGPGSVVPLDSAVADPVNVFVNDRLVARGEVLVVDDCYAVRITEVLPLPKPEKA
jgi:flagellar motor switch protein FliN/FliY